MQLRPLDPLANASPYQRLTKNAAKSFTLTEAQYDRVAQSRPDLIYREGDSAVVGFLYADQLQLHYGFPTSEAFHDSFAAFFEKVVGASTKAEAPRGLLIAFRDRPNRNFAETVFWGRALEQRGEWVEMNFTPVPEQPEPGDSLANGFKVREVTDADRDAIANIEEASSGLPRLTPGGVSSIYDDAKWFRTVEDAEGKPVAFLSLRSESGGWGVIQHEAILPEQREAIGEPLLDWAIAFLRNNGTRRIRRTARIGDTAVLNALRARGFTPGEAGVDYTRVVDPEAIETQWQERKARSSMITFGDWR